MDNTERKLICVIPARGGSKRLPRKNVLLLMEKPIVVWTIEEARASNAFDEVFVATDDEEIADIARNNGAKIPFLIPGDLCGDFVPSHVPCTYLMERVFPELGPDKSALVCLQPSSPLRRSEDIQAAISKFQQTNADFLVSTTLIDPHYFHWALKETTPDWSEMWFGDRFLIERPLLPPVFRPNGAIKIGKTSSILAQGNFFGRNLTAMEMPEVRSIHVATLFELGLCECVLQQGFQQ